MNKSIKEKDLKIVIGGCVCGCIGCLLPIANIFGVKVILISGLLGILGVASFIGTTVLVKMKNNKVSLIVFAFSTFFVVRTLFIILSSGLKAKIGLYFLLIGYGLMLYGLRNIIKQIFK